MIREKKSIDGALIVREKLLSLKRHFETEHENVLSVMYVNPPKDIKSSYFRKVTAVKIVFCLSREKGLSGHLKIRTKII